jgi:hypothetical protein
MIFGTLRQRWIPALMLSATLAASAMADDGLIQPYILIVDRSLPKVQVDAQILAARRYDTFCSSGDEALARAALAPDFTDRTLPVGRAQGLAGPLAASRMMRCGRSRSALRHRADGRGR